MEGYKITAIAYNETIAESFIEYWTGKGYVCFAEPKNMHANDGEYMGSWVVYKSTRKKNVAE